jgi:hypothetical protein
LFCVENATHGTDIDRLERAVAIAQDVATRSLDENKALQTKINAMHSKIDCLCSLVEQLIVTQQATDGTPCQ